MSHEKIKHLFSEAVNSIVSDISLYAIHPEKDFTRNKKLPPDKLISFLVSCGSSSTKIELLDFFGLDTYAPSSSALNQQRAKLSPKALEDLFLRFNSSLQEVQETSHYRFFAADGSTFTFLANLLFLPKNTLSVKDIPQKGFTVCI